MVREWDGMLMGDFEGGLYSGLVIGFLVTVFAAILFANNGKEDCEKDLPRTQECNLQWVKPEVSK